MVSYSSNNKNEGGTAGAFYIVRREVRCTATGTSPCFTVFHGVSLCFIVFHCVFTVSCTHIPRRVFPSDQHAHRIVPECYLLAQESPRVWPGTVGKDAKDIKKNNKLDGAKIEKVYVDPTACGLR